MGYQGQSGAYTDLETVHTASGLYTALTAPGGLTTYYDPLKGLGFSRRQEAVLNAYAQNINPFAGWTFGAYASEVKQFGVGEIKGAVNYSADLATLGLVHDPIAAHGQNEQAGAETLPVIADTVQYVDGAGEVVNLVRFVRGGAAKIVAGAVSRDAATGFVRSSRMQRGFAMIPGKAPKGGTYILRNPETGQVERTGMAANLVNRKSDHKKEFPHLEFEVDKRSNSRDARRGREQIIHDLYNPPLNKIEPISKKNNSKSEIERLLNEGRKL